MNSKEQQSSIGDKVIWWAEFGGIVAGILGALTHSAALFGGGVGIAAVGFAAEGMRTKKDN